MQATTSIGDEEPAANRAGNARRPCNPGVTGRAGPAPTPARGGIANAAAAPSEFCGHAFACTSLHNHVTVSGR